MEFNWPILIPLKLIAPYDVGVLRVVLLLLCPDPPAPRMFACLYYCWLRKYFPENEINYVNGKSQEKPNPGLITSPAIV